MSTGAPTRRLMEGSEAIAEAAVGSDEAGGGAGPAQEESERWVGVAERW